METQNKEKFELLRKPFEKHQISFLPKPYKKDSPKGNCDFCGQYHGLPAVHLEYVGHAAITDRLLEVDPTWNWEPMSKSPEGLPLFDKNGGLWIKLTILGVTRLGYGNAENKNFGDPGNREKEVIGDALRNASMRFGLALELWHKGDLHLSQEKQGEKQVSQSKPAPQRPTQPSPTPLKKPDPIQEPVINFADLSSTKIPFGVKWKGKSFKEVGHVELLDYIEYLERDTKQKGKSLSSPVQKIVDAAYKWLENDKFIPPRQDLQKSAPLT